MPWDILLIFFVLGVVVPWRGRARLKHLLAKPRVESSERISLYLSTIAFQWLAAAAAAWRSWAHGYTLAQLGLALPGRLKILAVTILGAAIIPTLQWFNLRRMGRSNSPARGPLQALAERILPQNSRELIPFCGLALTAGLCEEFLYRGFAMTTISNLGMPAGVVVLTSAVLFGMAHLYQGKAGFVSTTILGLLFGFARVSLASLLPVIAWHAGIDVIAGFVGYRFLVETKPARENVAVGSILC